MRQLPYLLLLFTGLGMTQDSDLPVKRIQLNKIVDVSGNQHVIPVKGAKATVVVFVMTDCPVANRMAPEIARIAAAYKAKKVSFFIAYVDPEASREAIQKHSKSYGLNCPAISDAKQRLVKATGVSITPEAAILDRKGLLVYRGRINDLFEDHGRPAPTTCAER
jgi:thiol-disulfide isomerase/thioredoxin